MDELLFQRHEREIAEIMPFGSQVLGSGAKLEKHDVRTKQSVLTRWWRNLYELKSTQKKSYSFKLKSWKDLVEYVYSHSPEGRPAWAVRFYGESVARTSDTPVLADLIVLDIHDYAELYSELVRYRERYGEI